MPRLMGALLLLCLHGGFTYASMDCNFGMSKSFLDKTLNRCPGLFDSSDKAYCCYEGDRSYCCDLEEFAKKTGSAVDGKLFENWIDTDDLQNRVETGLNHFENFVHRGSYNNTPDSIGIILPVLIAIAVIIFLVVCCISCFCCSCCPWYRRRHGGTVYGKVQAPHTVHIVQTPVNAPPSYTSPEVHPQNHYVPYPTNPAGFPQHPPPYSNEQYTKQAPFNPAYPPQ